MKSYRDVAIILCFDGVGVFLAGLGDVHLLAGAGETHLLVGDAGLLVDCGLDEYVEDGPGDGDLNFPLAGI